jgi:hypothetical protein
LLHDDNVDVASIDLDEIERLLRGLREHGRTIACLPGPGHATKCHQRRADLHITQEAAAHLRDFDRFEVDVLGFRDHDEPRETA